MNRTVVLFDLNTFYHWQSYNSISVLSDQEKCKNLISCWWRAVCTLGEWREVRWSRWRTGINLALFILWCCRLSISQWRRLPWCHASCHASHLHPFMSHLSPLTPLSGLQTSCVLGFSSLLPHCIIFPHSSSLFFVCFLSILWLLLQIRQYSQGMAAASGALISLINSLLCSLPLHVFVRPICCFLYFYSYIHQQIKMLPRALLGNHFSLSMLIRSMLNFYTPGQHLLFMVFFNV